MLSVQALCLHYVSSTAASVLVQYPGYPKHVAFVPFNLVHSYLVIHVSTKLLIQLDNSLEQLVWLLYATPVKSEHAKSLQPILDHPHFYDLYVLTPSSSVLTNTLA